MSAAVAKSSFFSYFYGSMFSDETRNKLQLIIRGTVIEGQGDTCTAVRNHLCASFSTSRMVKKDFEGQSIIKKEQVFALKTYATADLFGPHIYMQ